jgi:hypothetical protein
MESSKKKGEKTEFAAEETAADLQTRGLVIALDVLTERVTTAFGRRRLGHVLRHGPSDLGFRQQAEGGRSSARQTQCGKNAATRRSVGSGLHDVSRKTNCIKTGILVDLIYELLFISILSQKYRNSTGLNQGKTPRNHVKAVSFAASAPEKRDDGS